jgi:hypothetical protein
MSAGKRGLGVSVGIAAALTFVLAGGPAAGRGPAVFTAHVQGARAGSTGNLADVSADSATDAWAVGSDMSTHQPVIVRWDGHSLVRMPSPAPGELFGVSALSPTEVWAVGSYALPRAHTVQTLVLRWNGSQWSAIPSPDPSPFFNALQDVRVLSPTDVWATGYSIDARTHRHKALVLRWNGAKWSTIRLPANVAKDVLNNGLTQVAPTSPSSALAVVRHRTRVGHGNVTSDRIVRWNGKRWSAAGGPFLGASLTSVVSLSSKATWVVGDYCRVNRCPPFDTLTLRRQAKGFHQVKSPHLLSSSLASVSASSADDVWAVGSYCGNPCSSRHTLILRYGGRSWSRVASPDASLTVSSDLSPVSATDAWVIATDRTRTVLLHWNGTAWSPVTP